jgi:hypothetical protein
VALSRTFEGKIHLFFADGQVQEVAMFARRKMEDEIPKKSS